MKLYSLLSVLIMAGLAWFNRDHRMNPFVAVVIVGLNCLMFLVYDQTDLSKRLISHIHVGHQLENLAADITDMLDRPREQRKESGAEFTVRMVDAYVNLA